MSGLHVKHKDEFVLMETAEGLLCFTREEWSRATTRGDSIRRNGLRAQGMEERWASNQTATMSKRANLVWQGFPES